VSDVMKNERNELTKEKKDEEKKMRERKIL
jgi:hypothetical protein